MERKKKGFLRKSVSGALALLLAGTMLGSLIQPGLAAQAAQTADLDTTTKYTESLGDEYSTMYSGRVWTDKTVKEAEDDNFDITYSALSTSQEISGTAKAPLDVVFIIDISGSMVNSNSGMTDSSGNTYSRMKFTLDALNTSIETLMSMNKDTRVAVVAFSTNATVLLPLGHYEKTDATTPYFSLSRNTPLGSNVTQQSSFPLLYTNVKGQTQTSTRVYGGTNIQKGIYTGMNILTTSSTTVTVDGETMDRVPAVVMLSDGAPTYSVNQTSWWTPTSTSTDGNGSNTYYGNGMKAMLTATYMKAAINRNYTKNPAKFYTIGMGITGLSNYESYYGQSYYDGEQDLAYMTLDPANHWSDTNTIATNIKNAWNTYIGNNGTGTPNITVNDDDNYRVTHPDEYDIVSTGINSYVDGYYSADTAASVNTVFSDIVSKISVSTPEVPTYVAGDDPLHDGYVVYTDPIGEYMEVKSVNSIVHRGTTYELSRTEAPVTVDGVTTTTYVFEQNVETYIHGTQSLSAIKIDVTETADGDQTMIIRIPAALIPLRINKIELNTDGTVKTHTNNGATPIQVNYTVGLIDGLKNDDGTLNLEPQMEGFDQAAYEAYLEENTVDGVVNFYSNLYTGTNIVDGDKAGDTTVEFKASTTNPFYYMQYEKMLYTDPDCTIPATGDGLAADQYYYYKETFYHGMEVEEALVIRTGAQLSGNTVIFQKADGYWYRQAGTIRTNRMLEFLGEKIENNTNTAEDFYAPSYDSVSGNFKVYLGNNGVLGITAAGSLAISKDVTAAEGLTAPDKTYTFTVNLTDAEGNALTGTYKYEVTDAEGNLVKTSTISNGGTIELKDDQTATIINLPPNAEYEVSEAAVAGFTSYVDDKKADNASGKIVAGETVEAAFTNHYEVVPVTFPAEEGLKGKKVLDGRPWDEDVDSYTFTLTAYNDEPLPEVTEITVTKATDNQAEFDFGSIEFTKPGVYRYVIAESEPASDAQIAGISYSRALYRVIVTVTDNGDGTLSVESDIQKLYTDGAEPLFTYDADNNIVLNSGQEAQDEIVFTNTYSAESVVRVPVALKSYTDNSGVKPLTSGMFKFELTPLGVVEDGELVAGTADQNPMPVDEDGNRLASTITENEGTNVTFLPVTYKQSDIPDGASSITFRYQMKEVIPAEATAENDYTVDGMTYDPKVVEYDVTVSVSAESKVLSVSAVYPNGENVITFVNEYNETPVTLGEDTLAPIGGAKTLTGRDMKDGESFEFKLEAADDATAKAIEDGNVVLEKTETTVSGAADKAVTAFDFGKTTFKKQGTYTFEITETVPNGAVDNGDGTFTLNGVTYDAHVCTVTVVVTDKDNDSILEAAVTYSDGASGAKYNNTYDATFDDDTAISLDGNKVMTGRELTANTFFFEITKANSDEAAKYVPAAADGTIVLLANETYEEAGEYVYLIREQIPTGVDANNSLNGVTYDDSVYRVTVTVTDDLEGTLTAEITKLEKSIDDGQTYVELTANEAVVFANKYETTNATIAPYQLKKVLEGREWSADDQFTFKQSVVSADPEDGIILPEVTEITMDKDNNGIVQFGNITFTKPGTYVVQVEEVIPEDAVVNEDGSYTLDGITYSTNVIQSTFEVTDNGNGALEATRVGSTGSSEFKNIYETEGTLSGVENLIVNKNFSGREWGENDSFTFVLVAHDEKTQTAIENGVIVLPETEAEVQETIKDEISTDVQNAAAITIGYEDAGLSGGLEDTAVTNKMKAFGDILFKEAGDYVFHIREIDEKIPGVTYDSVARLITVRAVDNGDGTLDVKVVSITGGQYNDLTFINIYDPGDVDLTGHGNLYVSKTLEGREWKDTDVFTFTMEANMDDSETAAAVEADDIVMAGPTTIEITSDNKEFEHFGNITFKKAGRFEFVVTEQASTIGGVTNDADADRIVVIKVTDNGDGTLSAVIDGTDSENEALVFTNTYGTEPGELIGETDLKITKNLEGRDWKTSDSFSFTLSAVTDDETGVIVEDTDISTAVAVEKGYIVMPETLSKTVVDATGTSFGNITFKVPGTFQFDITEQPSGIAGVTDDPSATKRITVKVTDNLDGTLTVEKLADVSEELTFVNTYKATSITAVINVEKAMEGREFFETDAFEFLIRNHLDNPDAPLPENVRLRLTGAADKDGDLLKGAFGEIEYTEAGVYKYVITETATQIGGVTADSTAWEVTVTVTDNTETGKLEVSVNYGTGNAVVFTNVYKPGEVTLSGEADLKVTKVLDGRNWFDTDSFTFELTAGDAATEEAIANGNVEMPASTITIDKDTALSDNNAKVKAFGNIVFNEVGEYTFVITETAGTIDGLTYDTHSETVTVKVTDDGSGLLKAAVVSEDVDYTFTNTYKPDDTSAVISGTKRLNGRALKAGEFSFTITAAEGTPLPEVTTVQNAEDGSVTFGTIEYTAAGTYEYVVSEEPGSLGGVVYDGISWNVTVVVTYNPSTGVYETPVITYSKNDASNNTGFTFVNTYTTTGSDGVSIDAAKSVDSFAGSDFKMAGGEFEFTITPSADNPASDPIAATTVANAADGTVKFAENAVYTEEGTYIYTIEEVPGAAEGMTYDGSVYKVKVTVVDDSEKAQLQRTVVITKDGEVVDKITFKNEYRPGTVTLSGKTNLKVNKTFTGRKDNQWLDSDVFTFTLAADAETQKVVGTKVILPDNLTLTVNKNNKDDAHFGDIVFTEVGTYTFLITETNSGAGGITYDSHTMKVTVDVTDNQSGKLIAAAPVITDAGFNNSYAVEPVTATLQGKKTLNGRDLTAGEFEFTVAAITKDAPMPAAAKVNNAADGKVVFAPITFTKAGVYHYEIAETAGSLPGVTYDSTKVEAIVTVTDNNDGTLTATVAYKKNGADAAESFEFVNTYVATPVSVALEGLKRVEDASGTYGLKEGDFKFKLTPAANNPESDPYKAGTVVNGVSDKNSGTFKFVPNGQYTEPGTYTYDITEVSTGAAGVKYDASVYKVVVEVIDLGGKLSAKTTITKDGAAAEQVIFVNKYEPKEATTIISGLKVLEGKPLESGKFQFVLEAANDLAKEKLPEAKKVLNDETGLLQFETMSFDKAGVYLYNVKEIAGTENGVTYDSTVYTVEVTVSGTAPEKVEEPAKETETVTEEAKPEGETETVTEETKPEGEAETTTEETKPAVQTSEVVETIVTDAANTEAAAEEVKPEGEAETAPAAEEAKPEGEAATAAVAAEEAKPEGEAETAPAAEEAKPEGEAETAPAATEETKQEAATVTPVVEETQTTKEAEPQNTGELYAKVVIKKGDTAVNEIVFNNSYKPEKVTIGADTAIPLKGTKKLTGRALNAGEFLFEISSDDANAPLPANVTVANAANGSFEFGKITYDKTGVYYYTIAEKNNNISGITYDTTAYTVKVTITDTGFDGQLDAKAEILGAAEMVFKNDYKAAPAKAKLSVTKELQGRGLKKDEFEFKIEAVTKGAPLPKSTTAKNDAKGVAIFDEIEFTATGDYTYKITEIKGELQYVTYDRNAYEVTVHVTDNLKGNLVVSFDEDFEGIKFVNKYIPTTPPADEPEDEEKKEEKPPVVPPMISPKTGDGAAIGALLLAAGASLAGAIGTRSRRRKK